jgi:starvation-inducible DNA-binding protein
MAKKTDPKPKAGSPRKSSSQTSSTRPESAKGGGLLSGSGHAKFTVPSLTMDESKTTVEALQQRLVGLQDLALTLKHIHWNVVGRNFMSVHSMLDMQHAGVMPMIDALAERIATLGGVPSGLAGRLVAVRSWDDYALDRADASAHLGALDKVYEGIINDHRDAIETVDPVDVVSADLLTGQCGDLEQYHWFVRAHLTDSGGELATSAAPTEEAAARRAMKFDR